MLRTLLLYLVFLKEKLCLWKRVTFRGFTVVYAFKGSCIYWGRRIIVNSHSLSNLAGMHQRSIIVARDGGVVRIGDDVALSGTTGCHCATNVQSAGDPQKTGCYR